MANSSGHCQREITPANLTILLAQRVMGWTVGPDRFLLGKRSWIRRSAFQPAERIQDAHKLLLAACPTEYSMGGGKGQPFWARVVIGQNDCTASAQSLPASICLATARALNIAVEVCD